MMRIFRKNISVPQSTMREEPVENRQDMEIISDSSTDFTQTAHQNPSPNGKRRPFFGRVGGLLRRLLRRGKKKKKVFSDPEEINVISSALTEDNVNVSEKKTETTKGTHSALHQKVEEAVAVPIDGLQLSILRETVDIAESDTDTSSDTTYVSTGELEFTTSVETVAELKDWRDSNIPTETVPIPDTVTSNGSESEDTTQSTDSSDIVETESTLTDEYVIQLLDGMNICIGTECVPAGGRLQFIWKINVECETETIGSSSGSQIIFPDWTYASEEVTSSTTSEESDQPAQQTSTPVGNGRSFFSKVWTYFSKKEEREGEKVETSSKEVSPIQSDAHAPLTPESFSYHKIIGEGGFGKVLVASHPSTDELLAIKIAKIPHWPPKRIMVERQAMEMTGDCRFFPELFATFHTVHFLFYVMEYVDGGTLRQFTETKKPLDIETVRFIAAELLCGLDFLHSRGITHNDLHSENILIDSTGHVKIIDFGIASIRQMAPRQDTQPSTSSEVVQELPRDCLSDYLNLNSLLVDMGRRSNNTQLQDFIWKISTFPDPDSSLANLRHHPFFAGMNWDEMQAGRISSPYVMEPSPAINRSLKIDVKNVMDNFEFSFKRHTFAEMGNDPGFDFVSDRWRNMQQHH